MEEPHVSTWPLVMTVAACGLVSLALLGLAHSQLVGRLDLLYLEVAKTALNLLFVGIAAMLARTVVDRYVAARERERAALERREAEASAAHARRLAALTTLTSSYWNVRKCLTIIDAHRSAKSYGEQIRLIIDHRLDLQQLDNDICAGMHALEQPFRIGNAIRALDAQLARLTDEWREKYLMLSQQQKADELVGPEAKKVPAAIEALPVLEALRADKAPALHTPFEDAAGLIRRQVFPLESEGEAPVNTGGGGAPRVA
ncbi:hypothetical protein [Luteitalea sp.]|uniref:hypothetical protein n=1 Tax=Luteitalea sp. TaxID=2004800 RepID=UPI0025BA9685|nr:hypothetical protein [Luteitalea sp.]